MVASGAGSAPHHNHDDIHAEVLKQVLHMEGNSKVLTAHLLELGIVLHSLIIGIGLGTMTDSLQEVRGYRG